GSRGVKTPPSVSIPMSSTSHPRLTAGVPLSISSTDVEELLISMLTLPACDVKRSCGASIHRIQKRRVWIAYIEDDQTQRLCRAPVVGSTLGLEIQPITHCVQAEKARGSNGLPGDVFPVVFDAAFGGFCLLGQIVDADG